MNTMTEQPLALAAPIEQQPAMAAGPTRVGALDLLMDATTMNALAVVAQEMAKATITVPKHLQGKTGDCLAVAMQAAQWRMNPYAVAQKTHVVNGTLGYEAQLVIAVVQASGAIHGTFKYEFKGTGEAVECRAGAVLRGEQEITWGEWLCMKSVTTRNSPLWKTNPKQQLGYLQAKNWARLYTPGAILGIYTPDELEQIAPPKNMGPANTVQPQAPEAPQMPAGLLEAAENAAAEGVAAYQEFWKSTGPANRKHLAEHHPRLKQAAIDADAARTVDMPAADAAPGLDVVALEQRIGSCSDAQVLLLIGDDVATLPEGEERTRLEKLIAVRGEALEA
jgi:hypothetical protein